jgi:glycosyltransferase involved in cell wall biosynthesis
MKNVCYVVPEHTAESSQHFAHVPNLLRVLSTHMRVAALVERGEPLVIPGVEPVIVLRDRSSWHPLRVLEYVQAARKLRAAGFDTYFVRYSRNATTILLLTRPFLKHRVVFWSSGQADMRDPDGERVRVARGIKLRWNGWINRSVDKFVTGPETMVTFMQRRWNLRPERVALLYNDIDTSRFAPARGDEREALRVARGWDGKFVVLVVHRLAYRRGSRLLVPTFEKLVASGIDDVRLVVAGDGPDFERLKRDAAESSCAAAIELLGPVANRDLPDLYRAADCFLMPSYEEGFPRVLLEAMSTELPVVTTSAGGSADVMGEGYPYVVAPGDVDAMVRAIAELRGLTPESRVKLGRALRLRVVDRYATERVAEMLAQLLA